MGTHVSTKTEILNASSAATAAEGISQHGTGIRAVVLGWLAVMLALLISVAAGLALAVSGPEDRRAALEVLAFGIAVAGLGTAKTGIGFVLWGILRRIWLRIASITAALPALVPQTAGPRDPIRPSVVRTAWGVATISANAPASLFIHRMARIMWAPSLLMGAMFLYAGLILAVGQSQNTGTNPALAQSLGAWVQGTQFLGEGLLLSGISFLLGTILGAIRSGGGQVQQSLRVPVKTLRMPGTAKVFVALMMLGLMIEIAQFILYAYLAGVRDSAVVAAWSAWLGPFREFGLGVLLSAIVLALATIAKALGFQFTRVKELIETGR